MGENTAVEQVEALLIRAISAYAAVVGDPRSGGPRAVAVLADARRRRDATEAVVVALRAVAWFERSRLRLTDARALLDEAARLATRHQLPRRLVEVLVSRAAVALETGATRAAERDLARAEGLTDGDVPPDLDFMRAVLLHNLGRLDDAVTAYRRVLTHPRTSADNRGSAANNAALIAAVHGQYPESLRHLDHAEEIAAEVGPTLSAFAAHNRGLVLAQMGRLAESLREFERASTLFEQEEIPLGEHYIEYAEVLAQLRLVPEARALAERAVDELSGSGVGLMAAEAMLTAADARLLAGNAPGAAVIATAARAQFRRQRRTAWAARASVLTARAAVAAHSVTRAQLTEARRAAVVLDRSRMPAVAAQAHLVCGLLAEELGLVGSAVAAYRTAAAVRRGPVVGRLQGRLAAARAARLEGRDPEVLRHCRAGLADLAHHRAALGAVELRALASGHGVELGRLGLETLLRGRSPARVLDWMERTRSAALLVTAAPTPEEARAELSALAEVHAEITQSAHEAAGTSPELLARLAAAEERVRRATWQRPGSGVADDVVAPAAIRSALGAHTLVSYGHLDGRLFAVVVTAQRPARLVRLEARDEAVAFEADLLLFALRRLTAGGSATIVATHRENAELAVARLRGMLVGPLGVAADAPLVVVPSTTISRVPWSALHRGPVSVVPSASAWVRTHAQGRGRPGPSGGQLGPDRVLVVAGPGLPGAEEEAEAVAAQHRATTLLRPADATVTRVVEALGEVDLAHLACHGTLRGDNPTFSALELTGGPLTVHELDARGAAPRRVVLAACDSAADVAYDGGELLGFVSTLLSRGTAGLVASVVAVGDVEAVEIMSALHAGLAAGMTMAQALHAARADLETTDPRVFVNWCAFTAYGAG